ncbi:LOW QUALITY PROTEIN: hypothetical protein Cgig2_018138 [Carnegiea gigantea]|uniref:Reverse transcriptase domain-containing protein n=1 Tax=Carnegiea gigantea TaxID=171969 RepID=A0A9Q1KXI0_9CARY|nr:LOW QUALITY PROTEIN: hypothetical protein Cgig2_018138 [Carnegiea gigantea]
MLRRLKPIDTPAKFRNKNKYCVYHEDHGHTTAECRELTKALRKLADRGLLNCFLKKGGGGDQNQHKPQGKKDNDVNRNTSLPPSLEGSTTRFERGIPKRSDPEARCHGRQGIETTCGTNHDLGSRGHASLANLAQQCFGNTTQGRPTLNAVNAVVTPYLLLVQFELDDGKVGKLYEDQKMVRECYYVSLKSLGRKEEPLSGEASRPPKISKKSATKAMIVLSALA